MSAENILVNQFDLSQNYGLAGEYLNRESVDNLRNFVNSSQFNNAQIIFFWIDRPGQEDISHLIFEVNSFCSNVLHISQGVKYPGAINLMPHIDLDVSGSQPGIKTHKLWADTIKLCLKK